MHELTNASIESDRPLMLGRAYDRQIADTDESIIRLHHPVCPFDRSVVATRAST